MGGGFSQLALVRGKAVVLPVGTSFVVGVVLPLTALPLPAYVCHP